MYMLLIWIYTCNTIYIHGGNGAGLSLSAFNIALYCNLPYLHLTLHCIEIWYSKEVTSHSS
jgi:hypothetical protein